MKHQIFTNTNLNVFQTQDQSSGDLQSYQLMTSVSMPVFDRRENAVSVPHDLNRCDDRNLSNYL